MDPAQRDRIIFAVGKKPSLSAEEIAQNVWDRSITRNRNHHQKFGAAAEKAVDLMTKVIKSAGPITDNSKLNKVKADVASVLTRVIGAAGSAAEEIGVGAQGSAFELLQKLKQ